MRALLLAVVLALGVAGGALATAVEPDEQLDDPVLEERARELSKTLRCLVCQNQSIDDSDAQLARDMRQIVRERLVDGDTDAQVVDYLVRRYGDFVLLKPPIKPQTYILWFGPFLLLALAGFGVWRLLGTTARRQSGGGDAPLSAEERRRLDALLDDRDTGEGR
ncbi:MAG: cytochrome c-type biogenesis protein CcmH [Alphaproteobacteria bacterium]|nr:cytochrome c-type biogenesis protein CcmH [Alphaproteobacteria bacterium]MDX5368783.1 cytochrome c-type biogenesis protein CcmH [Alphaproteobacteria bacterium]MDX5463519.1 cytochrome c-type biogenesis protein CcmH [Alphaproteobacteria bacterium]